MKHITACRVCGGQPKRKRTVRMQTLEGLARYYWYECACGLREGIRQHFTKNSHARAYWNTQNVLSHTLNKMCDLLAQSQMKTTSSRIDKMEPLPIHCTACSKVVATVTDGWARTGTQATAEKPEMHSKWRRPVDSDFNDPKCDKCGGNKWPQGKPLEKMLTTPDEGFCEFDCLVFSEP